MSVVVLSSGSYCSRDEVARCVARDLGYDYIGSEVETRAADAFEVSLEKLRRALDGSTSLVGLRERTREKYLAYFQAELMSALVPGNIVYSGEVGHVFVADVSHVLKVRVTASLEDRAARCAEADAISVERARDLILSEDADREAWFLRALEVDGWHPASFDLAVDVSQVGVEAASKIIKETAEQVTFQPVTYSIKSMQDHELACRVRARLIDELSRMTVTSRDGEVTIRSKALNKNRKAEKIRQTLLAMEGVDYVVFE
jgi:cytidylate kinase